MLTQTQLDQFHRDGFLVLRGMIQGAELSRLREAADRVMVDGISERGDKHLYREINSKKTYFRTEWMWDQGDIFQAVTVNPELLSCIGQCVGHPFLPINDSFVCKIPGGNVPVEWHQDPPYGAGKRQFAETFAVPNFDVDIYLDDSTLENGCLWGIPGHHLVGHVELERFSEKDLFENFGAVPIEMNPGDVLFHGLSSPHGSAGNCSNTVRRIFYVHYMAKEVLEHCQYSAKRGGFTPDGLKFIEGMFEARRRLGWSNIDGKIVRFGDSGFEFTGRPTTPPRYWDTLIRQMPVEEIARKKRLDFSRAGSLR